MKKIIPFIVLLYSVAFAEDEINKNEGLQITKKNGVIIIESTPNENQGKIIQKSTVEHQRAIRLGSKPLSSKTA